MSATSLLAQMNLYFHVFRYEEELQKKADLENDFVVTKKVLLLLICLTISKQCKLTDSPSNCIQVLQEKKLLYCFASSFFTLCHLGIHILMHVHVFNVCVTGSR